MPHVTIIRRLEEDQSERFYNVKDFVVLMKSRFVHWPKTARVFHDFIARSRDVTPRNEAGASKLNDLPGELIVVVYPEGVAAVIGIVGLAAIVAMAFLIKRPNVDTPKLRSLDKGSPNNDLGNRQNEARPGGRIEEIYGQELDTLTLIAAPFRFWENNFENEVSYLCIGRGKYNRSRWREAETNVLTIPGYSLRVYDPFTSPNSGSPVESIGPAIGFTVLTVVQLKDVVGQTLRAFDQGAIPNPVDIQASDDARVDFLQAYRARATAPNILEISGTTLHANLPVKTLTELIQPGDIVSITIWLPGGLNLSGTYKVLTVTSTTLQFDNPGAVNPNWIPLVGSTTFDPLVMLSVVGWVGPIDCLLSDLDHIKCNFVALRGLYVDDGRQQKKFNPAETPPGVEIEIEMTRLDADGVPTADPLEFTSGFISGSDTGRDAVGVTINATPSWVGPTRIRARRVTAHWGNASDGRLYKGTIEDEIKFKDAYAIAPVLQDHFGDVTTVHTRQIAVPAALAVKERKLNVLATRHLPFYNRGTQTYDAAIGQVDVGQSIIAMSRDPLIGAFPDALVDANSIVDAVQAVSDVVLDGVSHQFSHTFDSDQASFEDMALTAAQAGHITLYRQGGVLKARPDIGEQQSTLLLNHRNIYGSLKSSFRFGRQDNNDGVQVDYKDRTGQIVTVSVPPDTDLRNPRSLDVAGLRNYEQAWLHAWREFNRVRYQNVTVELAATEEAAILVPRDRIMIADTTRQESSTVKSGEIVAVSGLNIKGSQPANASGVANTIFLQHTNGTVEAIPVTLGVTAFDLVLGFAPAFPLVTNQNQGVPTRYIVASDQDRRARTYLLMEMEDNNDGTYKLTAINYSPLYYQNDGMTAWLFFPPIGQPDVVIDRGPKHFLFDVTLIAPASTGIEPLRGNRWVYTSGVTTAGVTYEDETGVQRSNFEDYTITGWFYVEAGNTGLVEFSADLGSTGGIENLFVNMSDGLLKRSHDSINYVTAPWPAYDAWHFAAVRYVEATGLMRLYINGVPVDDASGVPPRSVVGDFILFANLKGRADDFREYRRALTDEEIFDIFRSTRYV